MNISVHDDRACTLGEGAFWHPVLNKLFWCDIVNNLLLCDDGREWKFNENISAMGWVSETVLILATETALTTFDLETAAQSAICDLEADNPATRSNDGRADPLGGFWIGTMGKQAEPDAGAIYRYYRGTLRRLFAPITISNAICFSPDGSHAYFTDTYYARVMKVPLDAQGWPCAPPVRLIDLSKDSINPDGAVTTVDGELLIAQWGSSNVAHYGQFGNLRGAFNLPTKHITCPALGGTDMSTLYVTTALQGLSSQDRAEQPDAGKTFAIETNLRGVAAPQVIL